MKKIVSVILPFALLLFLLLSPALIAGGIDRSTYTEKEKRRAEEYRGSIVFWHIVTFKTGEGSGYSLLRARCDRFERSSPYVFIKLLGMTPSEAKERISNGERPDIVSFPKGYEQLLGCDEAQAYMFDGYVLAVNRGLFSECGVQLPFGDEMSREAFYTLTSMDLPDGLGAVALSDTEGTDAYAALISERFTDEGDGLYEWEKRTIKREECGVGAEAFLDGRAVMLVCPYSELAALMGDKRAERMDIRSYNISGYTDLIQYIGVCCGGAENKREMCQRLTASVTAARFQSQIDTLMMFPVLADEKLYEDDYMRRNAYELIMSEYGAAF